MYYTCIFRPVILMVAFYLIAATANACGVALPWWLAAALAAGIAFADEIRLAARHAAEEAKKLAALRRLIAKHY